MAKATVDKISGRAMMHSHSESDISDLYLLFTSKSWYGIRRQVNQTSPVFTRIGNPNLHKVNGGLPIQNKMKRCLLLENGNVNYYLHPDNSTLKADGSPAILDGTDGDVMVEIPEHYYKAWIEDLGGNYYENYIISEYPLNGFTKIEKHYISAYEASLNRSTLKAASVVNLTTTYRGGSNNDLWDSAHQSLLGKPITYLTRANERLYSANKGAGWCQEPFSYFWPWRWLLYIEYASTNTQSAINEVLNENGYKQGGLGNGLTNASMNEWNTFNQFNPFCPCGITNSLGNNSGEVSLIVNDFGGDGISRTFKVNSYRGIENPYGHIWKRLDGININRTSGIVIAYGKTGTSGFVDNTETNYDVIGQMPNSSFYILNVFFENGIILPKTNGGAGTTGFCDFYDPPVNNGWFAPLSSGYAYLTSGAGIAHISASYISNFAYALVGFRLCKR